MPLTVTVREQPKDFGSARPAPGPARGIRLESVGVTVADLTRELAGALGYREGARGAVITAIEKDGPAAAARLRPGFLITAVDGTPVRTARECADRVREANAARGVRLRVASWAGGSVEVLLRGG
jgi:S1-C subfamily serine protease